MDSVFLSKLDTATLHQDIAYKTAMAFTSNFSKNYQKIFAIAKNGVKCQNFDERSQIKVFLDPLDFNGNAVFH